MRKRFTRYAHIGLGILLVLTSGAVAVVPNAEAQPVANSDGTVYDPTTGLTWLGDANLAGSMASTSQGRLQLQQWGFQTTDQQTANYISPSGSMNFATAQSWVSQLNSIAYDGHRNWTLPFSPPPPAVVSTVGTDTNCTGPVGGGPNGNSFGFQCTGNDLGALFYNSLGLPPTSSAVPTSTTAVADFQNLQPYLYWSGTATLGGHKTVSFNTGFDGSNTDDNYLYALPMVQGKPTNKSWSQCQYAPALQCSSDQTLVNDPNGGTNGVTWLADANLARSVRDVLIDPSTQTVLADLKCSQPNGTTYSCINADGSMTWATAYNHFIPAMRAYNNNQGWLGINNWTLPSDSCHGTGCVGTASPLGDLYIQLWHALHPTLGPGGSLVSTPAQSPLVPAFTNVQPYLYWSCPSTGCSNTADSAGTQEFSFSFGNGFQGTDLMVNYLYVMLRLAPPQAPFPTPLPCRPTQPPQCI